MIKYIYTLYKMHKNRHNKNNRNKNNKDICNKLTFADCELAILRAAVDKAEVIQGKKALSSPEIKKIVYILENFLRKKKLICYGGTAINNILPRQYQFYDRDVEIPDYDFYSPNALEDAKELVDVYVKEKFQEVEAKSGQHHGTYKVYVNFIPIADITFIPKPLFQAIKNESIKIGGIFYAPPNLLRMSMYLELSRPAGDVSRWEKVLKRLILLNKNYPLVGNECYTMEFQREMEDNKDTDKIYDTVQTTLIDQGVVFFGGYALSLYSRYMPNNIQNKLKKIPDFDVLTEEPLFTAQIVKERLNDIGIKKVEIIKRPGVGEIIAPHYEIKVDQDTVCFVYQPLACHSYNIVKENGYDIKVATIDTMLSFWLAFLYADRPYYDKDRILCMCNYLFEVQEKNRLAQKGLLKRFSINCMGHQETVEEMRAEKAEKFVQLKDKRNHREFDEWFLRYRPTDKKNDTENTNTNKTKRDQGKKKHKKTQKKKNGFFF
jgi:Poly(A) polymerase catalytic subunit